MWSADSGESTVEGQALQETLEPQSIQSIYNGVGVSQAARAQVWASACQQSKLQGAQKLALWAHEVLSLNLGCPASWGTLF